jgi:hypothetical protein
MIKMDIDGMRKTNATALFLFFLGYLLLSQPSFAELTRFDRNSFIHKYANDGDLKERKVSLTGYVEPFLMSKYCMEICNPSSSKKASQLKIEIEVDISSVHAIKIKYPEEYDPEFAYIIRTRGGRTFIKFKKTINSMLSAAPPSIEKKQASFNKN